MNIIAFSLAVSAMVANTVAVNIDSPALFIGSMVALFWAILTLGEMS